MSDSASSAQVYNKPRARDFGDIPLDTVDLLDAMSGLTSLQLGVYMRLRTSLWLRGTLPVGLKALAAIALVTPRTFERMAPCIAPLFDHGADGRWHDHVLEKKRGNRAALDITDRAVDPNLSAKRSAAGKLGQDAKRALRLVTTPGSDADGSPGAGTEANGCSFASKTPKQNDVAFASSGVATDGCFASFASPSHGSIDRSSSNVSSKRDDLADRAPVHANEAEAKSQANDASKTTEQKIREVAIEATGATSVPTLIAAVPGLELVSVSASADFVAHDGAAILARLRGACAGMILPSLLTRDGIAPLRAVLGESAELQADLETVVSCIVGLKQPLRSFTARWLHDEIRKARKLRASIRSSPESFKDPVLEAYRLVTGEMAGEPPG